VLYHCRFFWDTCTTTLPREVFTQRNFVADFIRLKLNFIQKQKQKITFWATLWAHGRLHIRHNGTFFTISYSWDVISRNLSKSAFFEGVCHFECKFQTERASPTNRCWYQKTRVTALLCGIKVSAMHYLVLSQSTHVTDGWTDGQTGDDRQMDRITTPRTVLAQLRRAVKLSGVQNI